MSTQMEMSQKRRMLVTVGVMTGTLLAAMEGTVVATAMPTVVSSLGGLSIYSWVFSIYTLTSTVTMPLWGKFSDLFGRRLCFQISITIFLIGSALSGTAETMTQLILFRALQGLGAGALVSLPLTIIGEIYTLQERARMQGIFSSVWGFSSILGPLLGGIITDHLSWRWIFFINIPFGLVAAVILSVGLRHMQQKAVKPEVDIAGAVTLTAGISLLLIACLDHNGFSSLANIGSLVAAIIFLIIFVKVEKRAAEPILPLSLFREKIFLASILGNLLSGIALFGSMPFITLFVQGVMNTGATEAGTVLMPLLLGWVLFSIVGARLLLRFGFRRVAITGMILVNVGFGLLAFLDKDANRAQLYIGVGIIGMGMGLSMITLLMALQHGVLRSQLGIVTSSVLFFRNIGGALGAAVMGVLMSAGLHRTISSMLVTADKNLSLELAAISANLNLAIEPTARAQFSPAALEYFRVALASGIHLVFLTGAVVALFALGSILLIPPGYDVPERSEQPVSQPQIAD